MIWVHPSFAQGRMFYFHPYLQKLIIGRRNVFIINCLFKSLSVFRDWLCTSREKRQFNISGSTGIKECLCCIKSYLIEFTDVQLLQDVTEKINIYGKESDEYKKIKHLYPKQTKNLSGVIVIKLQKGATLPEKFTKHTSGNPTNWAIEQSDEGE